MTVTLQQIVTLISSKGFKESNLQMMEIDEIRTHLYDEGIGKKKVESFLIDLIKNPTLVDFVRDSRDRKCLFIK